MKLKVSKEYFIRLRKVLKSKLNGGNSSRSQYLGSVALRYSAAFISWRKCELQAIDQKTRKLFTIYGGLHRKSDVDRFYIPRKDGGRGLIAIEDCVELAVKGLEVSVDGSEERLLQAAKGDRVEGFKAAFRKKRRKRRDCKIGRRKLCMESI